MQYDILHSLPKVLGTLCNYSILYENDEILLSWRSSGPPSPQNNVELKVMLYENFLKAF